MAAHGVKHLKEFDPSDHNACAPEWEMYKRDFLVHLDAIGLDEKPGKRKVGVLLSSMGREAIKIYDSFEWAVAVQADVENGIAAVAAENKHNVEHVFAKFDRHFGMHQYRSIKRQEFLNTKRRDMTIMDFIADLKRKAEHCQYGEQKEGFICDMIINGVNDQKCSEKLMEIPAQSLTLERVIQTCRQIELTKAHLKSLEQSDGTDVHRAYVNNAPRHKSRGGNRRPRGNFWRGHTDQKKNPGYANQQYCEWCCKHHSYKNCPASNQLCNSCGEKGHFRMSKRCRQNQPVRPFAPRGHSSYRGRSRGRARGNNTYHRDVHYASGSYEDENYAGDGMNEMFVQCHVQDVFTLKTNSGNSDSDWIAELNVAGKSLSFEIDSGARCNILSKQTADMFRPLSKVEPSDIIINGVSGVPIKSYGKMTLPCVYKDTQKNIEFQVIERNLNILGRDDSTALGLIVRVNSVQSTVGTLTDSYADVVGDEIGCLPGEYEIKIDETVTPVIHPPRPVPVAIREQVKAELGHLEKCGIITRVTEPTAWVNSMVCVRKKNGRVRICIDPSDLNKAILREQFPMNSIDDIATRLNGSKYFSKLDANMGYYQIKLTEGSSHLTTFNTPFGRYRYRRMPMGVKCSSEVFQREMTHHFGGMDGVEVVVDDILVHGKTLDEHNRRLKAVLDKARSIKVGVNCRFWTTLWWSLSHRLL